MANKNGTRAKGFVLTLEEYDKLKTLLNEKAKILGKRRNGKDKKETETSVLLRLLEITKEPFWYEI